MSQPARRQLFVTTALPYANGKFHIGHIMEYIQADIWVRFQRMQGHEVHFVGADDAHGAPIMLAAEKAGKTDVDTLKQYVEGLKENQTEIYYLVGDSIERLKSNPKLESATARGIEVLTVRRRSNTNVAEHTFALLLAMAKRLPAIANVVTAEQLASAGRPLRSTRASRATGSLSWMSWRSRSMSASSSGRSAPSTT